MKYVTTTKFKDLHIPIFIGELNEAWAMTRASKAPFDCGDGIINKYQIILDKGLIDLDDDFVKYIIHHEFGHIEIFLKHVNGELSFKPDGSFKEELFCDVFSLTSIGKYNLKFIAKLEYEDPTGLQKMINKYMKTFISRGVYKNIDDILKINFDGIL